MNPRSEQVAPRVDPTSRSSLSSAKGAQHVVHGAGEYSSVAEAIADCDAAVAFHVWHDGLDVRSLEDVGSLLRAFPGGRMDASMDEDEDEDAGRDVVPPKEEDDADADAAGECEESCPLFLEPVPDEALGIKDEIPTGDAEGTEEGAEGGAEVVPRVVPRSSTGGSDACTPRRRVTKRTGAAANSRWSSDARWTV